MKHAPTYLAQCDSCGAQEEGSVGWDYGGAELDLPAGWVHDYGQGRDFCPKCLHCLTGADRPLLYFNCPIPFAEHGRQLAIDEYNEKTRLECEANPPPACNGLLAWCPRNV